MGLLSDMYNGELNMHRDDENVVPADFKRSYLRDAHAVLHAGIANPHWRENLYNWRK